MAIPLGIKRGMVHHSIPEYPIAAGRSGLVRTSLSSTLSNPIIVSMYETSIA